MFPWNGKVFNDLYYFHKEENSSERNLKMCLFPGREKKLFSLFLYIFASGSTKWEKVHHCCYFHKQEKNSWFISLPKSEEHLVEKLMFISAEWKTEDPISPNYLKVVFHKFYLVHSWIPWTMYMPLLSQSGRKVIMASLYIFNFISTKCIILSKFN